MKKVVLVTLVLMTLIFGLASCDDKSASEVGGDGGGSLLSGHYNIYNYTGKLTSGGETMYFEGDQYWLLDKNDKMQAGGKFTYDDTYITWNEGSQYQYAKQKYEIIDKNSVFFILEGGKGQVFLREHTLKRSGRKGHMEPVNQSWTFVDD
jgi:hypothetical protein